MHLDRVKVKTIAGDLYWIKAIGHTSAETNERVKIESYFMIPLASLKINLHIFSQQSITAIWGVHLEIPEIRSTRYFFTRSAVSFKYRGHYRHNVASLTRK